MKKEACQRVEMSQSLLRPEELGTRVRSDVSLSGRSHSTRNIAQLPSCPSHPATVCASTPASCSIFFTVGNSASSQVIHGSSYGKGKETLPFEPHAIVTIALTW